MQITYDPVKNAANIRKHGIALSAAATLDWDRARTWIDARNNYGEVRLCAIGFIGNRLYHVSYVERNGARRIISLRKANSREEKDYAQT